MNHKSGTPISDELQKAVFKDEAKRPPLQYMVLLRWAIATWNERYPKQSYVPLWSGEDCANGLAQQRIKVGRRLKGNGRYLGRETLDCPHVMTINSYSVTERKVNLTESVGALIFHFESKDKTFDVLYVSSYYSDGGQDIIAIALVPPQYLETWADFHGQCYRVVRHLERSQRVYVIGGADVSFEPTVAWENVILSETLKADLRSDLETFFSQGVGIYRQLGLPPFRKILLVGPPGTGKTTLCAALAKLALERRCVVIYVSAADKEGASFNKIHRALKVAAESRHPVLLIVEELDAFINKEDKSQILNVLDGMESPNNPRGALLLATTNYPEMIDERISKRPGRVDRVIYIPPIIDEEQATRMLIRYMGPQWREEHRSIAHKLVGQTGVFVREIALYARMLAANRGESHVSLAVLQQSVARLTNQLATGDDLLPRRPVGFASAGFNTPAREFAPSHNTSSD